MLLCNQIDYIYFAFLNGQFYHRIVLVIRPKYYSLSHNKNRIVPFSDRSTSCSTITLGLNSKRRDIPKCLRWIGILLISRIKRGPDFASTLRSFNQTRMAEFTSSWSNKSSKMKFVHSGGVCGYSRNACTINSCTSGSRSLRKGCIFSRKFYFAWIYSPSSVFILWLITGTNFKIYLWYESEIGTRLLINQI